jgi:hypothetical protein
MDNVTENTDVIAAEDVTPAAPTIDQLEQEGDIAADYIEEFLDICDLDGDIDIDARNGRAYLSVNSSEPGNLRLLSKPDTVNALQEQDRVILPADPRHRWIAGSAPGRADRPGRTRHRAYRSRRNGGLPPPDVIVRAQARARHRVGAWLRVRVPG